MFDSSKLKSISGSIISALFVLTLSSGAIAAGSHGGGHGQGDHHADAANIGKPGKASEVSRTLKIVLTDNLYSTETILVTRGETIRFILHNKGELVYEFNISTPEGHVAHQKEMVMMVEHGVLKADKINHDKMKMDMGGGKTMEHNDPNSVLLEPGKSGEIIWKFTKNAELEFACNILGHYDAGMVGDLLVK